MRRVVMVTMVYKDDPKETITFIGRVNGENELLAGEMFGTLHERPNSNAGLVLYPFTLKLDTEPAGPLIAELELGWGITEENKLRFTRRGVAIGDDIERTMVLENTTSIYHYTISSIEDYL